MPLTERETTVCHVLGIQESSLEGSLVLLERLNLHLELLGFLEDRPEADNWDANQVADWEQKGPCTKVMR